MTIDPDLGTLAASDDPDDVSSNSSGNRPFADVLATRLSRRGMLRAGTVGAAAGFLGAAAGAGFVGAGVGAIADSGPAHAHGRPRRLLGFSPVPPGQADVFTVPEGYSTQVLIPWGTPLHSGGPATRSCVPTIHRWVR